METIKKHKPSLNNNNNNNNHKTKPSRTFQRVINLRTWTKIASSNGVMISEMKQKAGLEALIAMVFATVTSIKAAYAELQMAQHPYNSEAIQAADQVIVEQLKVLSELKHKFLNQKLDLFSPQVSFMLAEIQEQQSLMRTYELTIRKLESDNKHKESHIGLYRKRLEDCIGFNKSMEKKLNQSLQSGSLSMFDNLDIQFTTLNPGDFVKVLHFTLKSVRGFVRLMMKEMELAKWDLDEAAKTIEPKAVLAKKSHLCLKFESFVCRRMLEGFDSYYFGLRNDSQECFNEFNNLKSVHPKPFLLQNPDSSFAKFIQSKYLQLFHPKMEYSFFGNLKQRKLVISNGYSDTVLFTAFAEMGKRFWLLHCLGFSMNEKVSVFQVKKDCRFSEVYMENVTEESLFCEEINDGIVDVRVGFTVVPGFKIGKTVIQSQVYLSPVIIPVS